MPLSDIVSLGAHPVQAITSENAHSVGEWFPARRIGDIELARLGELLGAGSFRDLKEGFSLIGQPLPQGPWPLSIPKAFTDAVRDISEESAGVVSVEWAQIEEFRGGVAPGDLARYILDLRDFLRTHPGPYILRLAM